MANVLIVAYLLIVLALIAVILIQRSEGGALGIGGGSGGGLMTARGSANLLTRTTAILAVLFFATAIGLTIFSELDRDTSSILERATTGGEGETPTSVLEALSAMQGDSAPPADESLDLPVPEAEPAEQAPSTQTPSTQTPSTPALNDETSAPAAPAEDLPVPAAPPENAPAGN